MHTSVAEHSAVFTTLLVRYGTPHYLKRHIARLNTSQHPAWKALSEQTIRKMIELEVRKALLTETIARVRIISSADGITINAERYSRDFDSFILIPYEVDAPLGNLKRWPFVNLGIPENGDLLLVDSATGRIFEGNKTTVFVEIDGVLVTPPLDGSILPGVMRENIIKMCKKLHFPLQERALSFNEIIHKKIYVSNALIGLQRAELQF
ncbi:aminotransferase class IV [bacterium]|nr:aminotransferase class IV [bacterium]